MANAGVKLDDDLFAHIALHHLPLEHQMIKSLGYSGEKTSLDDLQKVQKCFKENHKIFSMVILLQGRGGGGGFPFHVFQYWILPPACQSHPNSTPTPPC